MDKSSLSKGWNRDSILTIYCWCTIPGSITKKSEQILSPQNAAKELYELDILNNRNLFCHDFALWKHKIKVLSTGAQVSPSSWGPHEFSLRAVNGARGHWARVCEWEADKDVQLSDLQIWPDFLNSWASFNHVLYSQSHWRLVNLIYDSSGTTEKTKL